MDAFSPDRFIAIALLLGALLLIWVFVRMNRARLSDGLRKGKQLEVTEIRALGPDTRAILLQVDRTQLLVVLSKRSGVAVHELSEQRNSVAATEKAA